MYLKVLKAKIMYVVSQIENTPNYKVEDALKELNGIMDLAEQLNGMVEKK